MKVIALLMAVTVFMFGLVCIGSLLWIGGNLFAWLVAFGLIGTGVWLVYRLFLGL